MSDKPKFSRREREILDILFALGNEAAAEEIRERLTDPPTSSAVRAMLARLEAKGALRHKEKGLRYVYLPTTTPRAARRSALRRVVDVFFDGSAGQVVTALLDEEKWTDEELDCLAAEIERRKHS
ncbi:MAG TPA: BlaI/MecI/CopY family transcriptional regulator [Thermoanaerobaculia bacterium]|nr:BlaI/MecI/CopY family transcriptional regulator [Thermoanaerobaculia bacterium]